MNDITITLTPAEVSAIAVMLSMYQRCVYEESASSHTPAVAQFIENEKVLVNNLSTKIVLALIDQTDVPVTIINTLNQVQCN